MATNKSLSPQASSPFVLEQAFKQFSLETERLESVYQALQKQCTSLQNDLKKTNTRLYSKLAELDFLTSYLDTILNHMSQGILFIDLNGTVTTCNQPAEHILQITRSQLLFHQFWEVLPDDLFGFSLKETLQTSQCPKTIFTTRQSLDGKKQELEIETTFISLGSHLSLAHPLSPQQNIQGMLILIRDITDLRQLQKEASRQDRLMALGEMAARVAHEIRNPLGGIKGFATLLKDDLKDHPDLQQMTDYIIEGTDGLNRLVSKVLNYTRPFQIHFEWTDLSIFMNEMLQLIKMDKALKSNIHCTLNILQPDVKAPIDAQLFKSAILNLLVNALQAMPDGGELTVELDSVDNEAMIRIKDTGIGISEDHLDKIFSPFFTTKDAGNGFGLSEAHKVIQAHHGTIEVLSKVGKGTIFTIKIPSKVS